jgi:hypothetical protein
MRRANLSDLIVGHAVESINGAAAPSEPFHHLRLEDFFPSEVYNAMRLAMPGESSYRPMSGRAREARLEDGTPTRTKMHLLPEIARRLPGPQREIWDAVGAALCSVPVRDAFVQRLAPGLEKRFGGEFRKIGMYPIPILTRDVTGYRIGIHPDTRHKGMTIQLYLPPDDSISHVGTLFHRRLEGKKYERVVQVPFVPNSGYAFAVGTDTYHSADELGPEVRTRDSILLTYFVDETAWQKLSNRAKRFGNLVASEAKRLVPRG